MVNPERSTITHNLPLGYSADYIVKTGQICIGNKQVGKLGFQANVIFEMLVVHSCEAVSIRELAQTGDNRLIDAELFFTVHPDDEARVRSTIERIRATLKKISPDLASKLQTVHLRSYRWGNPEESYTKFY